MRDYEAKNYPEQRKGSKCYKCNKFGHMVDRCPSAAQGNMGNKNLCEIEIKNTRCDTFVNLERKLTLMRKERHREVAALYQNQR